MNIEKRLHAIEERNKRVTQDKVWERSLARRLSITAITYLTASILFIFILPHIQCDRSSLIPTSAYLLSTLSLPWIRKIWENSYKKTVQGE